MLRQIIRDLVEISINKTKEKMGQESKKAKAERNAEEKILDILVSSTSSNCLQATSYRQKLRSAELNDKEG